MTSKQLGEFLRARRRLLDPADFDVPLAGPRRTAGLRRDEVALLAGVSTPYYARLEQGTDRNPSPAVLAALGRVLRLDAEAIAHLHTLGAPGPRRTGHDRADDVSPELERVVAAFTDQAAVVINRYRDVLIANQLAGALNPAFCPGENLLRHVFLDPAAREIYPDWADVAGGGVAGLRAMNSDNLDDSRLNELICELSAQSETFHELWARHDVHTRDLGHKRYRTRRAGVVTVEYQSFVVNASDGQTLFVFSTPPGTPDAASLRGLIDPA